MSTTPGCGALALDTVTVCALPLMWGWGLVALGMALKLLVTGLPKSAEYEPGEGVRKATVTGFLLLFLLGLSSFASWMAA